MNVFSLIALCKRARSQRKADPKMSQPMTDRTLSLERVAFNRFRIRRP